MTIQFDILGIGNAIVDVVARSDDAFLSHHDMRKGSMTLVNADTAQTIYAAMPPGQESSGGSAANTCAVAAALGSWEAVSDMVGCRNSRGGPNQGKYQ